MFQNFLHLMSFYFSFDVFVTNLFLSQTKLPQSFTFYNNYNKKRRDKRYCVISLEPRVIDFTSIIGLIKNTI